jgi:hypothetical protein
MIDITELPVAGEVTLLPQVDDEVIGASSAEQTITLWASPTALNTSTQTKTTGLEGWAFFTWDVPQPWPSAESVTPPAATTYSPIFLVEHEALKQPVLARLEATADEILLEDINTGIFGVGTTGEAAVADFVEALVDHAEVLRGEPALPPDLARQLVYLEAHLAR